MIEARQLSGGYEHFAVREVNLTVRKGEFLAILGPNGSGKSTLLKLLTGILPPRKGEVLLRGRPIHRYASKERAKLVSVLGQEEQVAFPFTVDEVVALGRYPHQTRWFDFLSPRDRQVIDEAMEITRVKAFRHKPFHLLSGGEKQRVLLAKAFAQEAQCLFLDEPTNHLDIKHSFDVLGMLKEWQKSKGLTVVAILHDLNLAALYADRVAMMKNGSLKMVDDIYQLKDGDELEKLYEVKVETQPHPRLDRPQFMLASKGGEESKGDPFLKGYNLLEDQKIFCLSFTRPLKAMTNGQWGKLGWVTHFCQLFDLNLTEEDGLKEARHTLERHGLSAHQTALFVSEAKLDRYVLLEQDGALPTLVGVTVGKGKEEQNGTGQLILSIMIFFDGFLTDGALVEGLNLAIGARERALAQASLALKGSTFSSPLIISNRQAQGMVAVAATQRGMKRYHQLPVETVEPLLFQAIQKVLKPPLTLASQ